MGNCGYTRDTAEGAIRAGAADLIAFGRIYMRCVRRTQRTIVLRA